MKKIIIIGSPGSGKSTFARKLHDITGIPLFYLDMMYWNADKTTVPKSVFRERLQNTMTKDCWIIDGNYGSTMEERLQQCDTVFFLDYTTEVCLDGIAKRKGKVRADMPWVEEIDEDDGKFITFIKEYNIVSRPKVMTLLDSYSDRDIFIFKNRDDARKYLYSIK